MTKLYYVEPRPGNEQDFLRKTVDALKGYDVTIIGFGYPPIYVKVDETKEADFKAKIAALEGDFKEKIMVYPPFPPNQPRCHRRVYEPIEKCADEDFTKPQPHEAPPPVQVDPSEPTTPVEPHEPPTPVDPPVTPPITPNPPITSSQHKTLPYDDREKLWNVLAMLPSWKPDNNEQRNKILVAAGLSSNQQKLDGNPKDAAASLVDNIKDLKFLDDPENYTPLGLLVKYLYEHNFFDKERKIILARIICQYKHLMTKDEELINDAKKYLETNVK